MQDLDLILQDVQKPLRYLGGEWNSVRKDPTQVSAKLALIFPDTYEVGMSHLGLKILYDLINKYPYFLAERVFAPWPDMERKLREQGIPIFSLENRLSLRDFDILGFSLQYELCYTNILTILDLGGIPFRAADRDLSYPLLIGGGPCTSNPEPMADFFDAFLIGDGEEALPELLETFAAARQRAPGKGAPAKRALLAEIARIPGWYVPSLYKTVEDPATGLQFVVQPLHGEGTAAEGPPYPIERRFVEDLSRFPFPTRIIVPNTEVVHDRVAVEIARGCLEGCRFCQAGTIYRPLRERRPSEIVSGILQSLESTGYDDASLTSLSTGDYRCIDPLVSTLMGMLEEREVALSVSSLRASSLSNGLTEQIKRVRRTGFTIAPEAGTQRLRDAISKGISEKDILQAAQNAFAAGWTQLKMYFMIGLPTETLEDVDAIVELGKKVLAAARSAGSGRPPDISISVSTFIPKPFAPFQWCRMEDRQSIQDKQDRLRAALRKTRLRFKWHEPAISYLECVFSRGDRKLAGVIEQAWKLGCRFDGWTEELRMDLWEQAFADCRIDQSAYLKEIPLDSTLPWDHLNPRVRKEWLQQELGRALKSKASPACGKPFEKEEASEDQAGPDRASPCKRPIVCYNCGLECDLPGYERLASEGLADLRRHYPEPKAATDAVHAAPAPPNALESDTRYFAAYQKEGVLRYASHLDMIRLIGRVFGRAGFRLRHSQGFHPKPVFTFGPALAVGKASSEEWVEFHTRDQGSELQFLERINSKCPEGLRFTRWQAIPDHYPSLAALIDCAEYSVRLSLEDGSLLIPELLSRIEALLSNRSLVVFRQKQDRTREVDIRPGIHRLTLRSEEAAAHLSMILSASASHSVRPEEVLSTLLGNRMRPWFIRREALGILGQDGLLSPLEQTINPYRTGAEIGLNAERAYCQQQLA